MPFGWGASADDPEPVPAPWWETDDADDSAEGEILDPNFADSLQKTAIDVLFDKKLFERVCREVPRRCKAAAEVGFFSAQLEFLKFGKETPWEYARNTGAVYAREFKIKFATSGITLHHWRVEEEFGSTKSTLYPVGRTLGLVFTFSFAGNILEKGNGLVYGGDKCV